MDAKEQQKLRRKAELRRRRLTQIGVQGVDNPTDEQIVNAIPNPAQVKRNMQHAVKTGSKTYFVQKLEQIGLNIPPDHPLTQAIQRRELREKAKQDYYKIPADQRARAQEELGGGTVREQQGLGAEYGGPKQVTYNTFKNAMINIVQKGIDYHNYVVNTHSTYIWGRKTSNPVEKQLLQMVYSLSETQAEWLYHKYTNGDLFSDSIDYDSEGDGMHTRYLFNARTTLAQAKQVDDKGAHPVYGTATLGDDYGSEWLN